jgi:hypothetical protein
VSNDAETIRRLFARYDPAADVTDDARKYPASPEQITARWPAGPAWERRAPGVSRRRLLAGGVTSVTAAAAVLAAVMVSRDPAAPAMHGLAATPRLLSFQEGSQVVSAREVLEKAASSAQRQPDRAGAGRYQYVETRGWYLNTAISARAARSAVIPVIRRQWIAADGSGRIITRPGSPWFPSAESRRAWHEAGDARPRPADQTYGPGGLSFMWRPGSLSSDPAVLRRQLAEGHPASLGPAETLVAVGDLYGEQPVDPAIRAAVLRVIAALPGLRYDGTATDRAGRTGIGVSVESDLSGLPTRYIMIFSPGTGQLLDSEQVLTTSAGKLGVPIPSVIAYTIYLSSGRTHTLQPSS